MCGFKIDLRQVALSNDIVDAKIIEITTHNKLPVVFLRGRDNRKPESNMDTDPCHNRKGVGSRQHK